MELLANKSKKRYLCQLLFIIIISIILKLTLCSDISELSDYSQNESENIGTISKRPEGAVPIPIKKSFFDRFKLEVVADKYITKEGKKVKVILKRKNRPAFGCVRKWLNKRKLKKAAKKKYKKERKRGDKKVGIFKRMFGRKRKDETDESSESSADIEEKKTPEILSEDMMKESESSVSKDNVFEESHETNVDKSEESPSKTDHSSDLENKLVNEIISDYKSSTFDENTGISD